MRITAKTIVSEILGFVFDSPQGRQGVRRRVLLLDPLLL